MRFDSANSEVQRFLIHLAQSQVIDAMEPMEKGVLLHCCYPAISRICGQLI